MENKLPKLVIETNEVKGKLKIAKRKTRMEKSINIKVLFQFPIIPFQVVQKQKHTECDIRRKYYILFDNNMI